MLTGIRIFEIEFPPGFCQALEIGVSLANDGFEIDRRDQEMRGPGEFLGVQQSGTPLLHLAELETDAELLEWTLALAPQMRDRHPHLAAQHVLRWLGDKASTRKPGPLEDLHRAPVMDVIGYCGVQRASHATTQK